MYWYPVMFIVYGQKNPSLKNNDKFIYLLFLYSIC